MKDFNELEKKLDIQFENKDLLIQAFIHRSYLNENPDFHLHHNERMEFLGDAVLELVVTEYLFENYPKKQEGIMTNWRAALVNSKMLSQIAYDLDFNDFLFLSQGEAKEKGKARQFILANSFEAFVGALYLDQGYDACNKFIRENLVKELPEIIQKGLYKDAKSDFQEQAQEKTSITPHYKVLKEWGPDHDKNFVIGVFLKDKLIAEGQGSSKQEAEEQAAQKALEQTNW